MSAGNVQAINMRAERNVYSENLHNPVKENTSTVLPSVISRKKQLGVGPVVSYIKKYNVSELLAELKWLKETTTTNRLKGDTFF